MIKGSYLKSLTEFKAQENRGSWARQLSKLLGLENKSAKEQLYLHRPVSTLKNYMQEQLLKPLGVIILALVYPAMTTEQEYLLLMCKAQNPFFRSKRMAISKYCKPSFITLPRDTWAKNLPSPHYKPSAK